MIRAKRLSEMGRERTQIRLTPRQQPIADVLFNSPGKPPSLQVDDQLHLRFGWTGQSISTGDRTDLTERQVRFRDYIMEGFLAYSIQLSDSGTGCRMQIDGEGSSRDWSIRPQVRHYIKAAGLEILSEDVSE